MIDPRTITKFDRTTEELEEFLLFAIVVAGKNAFQQAIKLEQFLTHKGSVTPFQYIRWLDSHPDLGGEGINRVLRQVKMGQYERITATFRGVAHFLAFDEDHSHSPLHNVSVDLLTSIKGIGMKTARFFVMHTRPNVEYACLDTHILHWLSNLGYADVPKTTPRGNKYIQLESIFLQHARHLGKSPADLDLQIWNEAHNKIQIAA